MYKTSKTLFLRCETPMHVGSGSDLGIVDLPIQRERHTSFPKIEASSFKGAMRERFESVYPETNNRVKLQLTFGYDGKDEKTLVTEKFKGKDKIYESQYAGALGFTDARILFFPVKSMKGVYALTTCPMILDKLVKELDLTETSISKSFRNAVEAVKEKDLAASDNKSFCYTSSNSIKINCNDKEYVILEEYAFEAKNHDLGDLIAGLKTVLPNDFVELANKLIILSNDDFKDFTNLSTEVITRTKISNITGTVEAGALFTEEYLPPESVLYALILASPVFQNKIQPEHIGVKDAQGVMDFFEGGLIAAKNTLQIGGNVTLGKGIVTAKF